MHYRDEKLQILDIFHLDSHRASNKDVIET